MPIETDNCEAAIARRGMKAGRHLAARALACRRGDRVLFRDLDLDVATGELVWLRAANGYGKTTLLRVIAGLSKPELGTITWREDGVAVTRGPLLFVAHANALKEDLTVAESVRYLTRLHGLDASGAAIADAIRRLGLDSRRDAPIRTLSQGQRRRVALTRLCLSRRQATWLLDEPFDALDADAIERVGALLDEHAAHGGNVLFTSHVTPPTAGRPMRVVQLDAAVANRAA